MPYPMPHSMPHPCRYSMPHSVPHALPDAMPYSMPHHRSTVYHRRAMHHRAVADATRHGSCERAQCVWLRTAPNVHVEQWHVFSQPISDQH